MKKRFFSLIATVILAGTLAQAKVVLPPVFSDNMVLQQQTTLRIRGKSLSDTKVTVNFSWSKKTVEVVSDHDGFWKTEVVTPKAGGPYTMTFSDGEETVLNNVLIGEVWLGSGQSNMDQAMAGWWWGDPILNSEEEISNAHNSSIRLFQVDRENDLQERNEFGLVSSNGGWQECNPENVREFSAVCYFFACRLWEELKVPVGMIQAASGGSRIEAWVREDVLEGVYGCKEKVDYIRKYDHDRTVLDSIYHSKVFLAEKGIGEKPRLEIAPCNSISFPSGLWNSMIHPLLDFPVKGLLWYQGCGNVRASDISGTSSVKCSDLYEECFNALISDWREQFGNPDMPFYFFQLANWSKPMDIQPDSEWAALREAQATALHQGNTGMVVNIDKGDEFSMHGPDKREQTRRLAAIALNKTYGLRKIEWTAPIYSDYKIDGNVIRILFDRPDGCGNLIQEDDLDAFIVAGADRVWHVANAHTEGNTVVVSCPDVKDPLAVRYGWADNPHCTLRTADNLHVAPFRTDNWKL